MTKHHGVVGKSFDFWISAFTHQNERTFVFLLIVAASAAGGGGGGGVDFVVFAFSCEY